ncbi:uncharacterized protein LOC128883159 isoform X2 [Hylaeus volcanicus]|uniref:uncharacterized protein LOC128883159 isoform X2 n=1 Tax=Hylaeus volcanicus TaxID=313075 RepID=UPI0023B7F2C7|nr:uncharacterized protein LOC128883159 isoform X2 [Hylaeus volcanicus]
MSFQEGLGNSENTTASPTEPNSFNVASQNNNCQQLLPPSLGFIESLIFATKFYKGENESSCCECEGGGELICCDTCVKAFHFLCLPVEYRPTEFQESTVSVQWSCPICVYYCKNDNLEKRRGIVTALRHPLPVPSKECPLDISRLQQCSSLDLSLQGNSGFAFVKTPSRTNRLTQKTSLSDSHYHYLFEDIKKENKSNPVSRSQDPVVTRITRRTAAAALGKKTNAVTFPDRSTSLIRARMNVGPGYQVPNIPIFFLELQSLNRDYSRLRKNFFSRPFSSTRVVYSSSQWISKASELALSTPFSDFDYPTTEHSSHSINNHASSTKNTGAFKRLPLQTSSSLEKQETLKKPCIDTQEQISNHCISLPEQIIGNSTLMNHEFSNHVLEGNKKETYTHQEDINKNILLKLKPPFRQEDEPNENSSLGNHVVNHNETNKFIRGLSEEVFEAERRLDEFILKRDRQNFIDTQEKLVEFCHTLSAKWPPCFHWPYSSEYAYKILFYTNFDTKEALDSFQDSSFNFQSVCDPPIRPYFNKWKPKDKRSFFPSTPFPPPQHLSILNTSHLTRSKI